MTVGSVLGNVSRTGLQLILFICVVCFFIFGTILIGLGYLTNVKEEEQRIGNIIIKHINNNNIGVKIHKAFYTFGIFCYLVAFLLWFFGIRRV